MTITNSNINANQVNSSGDAQGGGIYCADTLLSLKNCTVSFNQANAGAGASGVAGGDATGGGLDVDWSSTATIVNTEFLGNSARGGAGGSGADGGNGEGGAIFVGSGGTATLYQATLEANLAIGGNGLSGGTGLGGGIYVASGAIVGVTQSAIILNVAQGGHGQHGGSDGQGIGGGVYDLGTFTFDAASVILFNFASTNGSNIGP